MVHKGLTSRKTDLGGDYLNLGVQSSEQQRTLSTGLTNCDACRKPLAHMALMFGADSAPIDRKCPRIPSPCETLSIRDIHVYYRPIIPPVLCAVDHADATLIPTPGAWRCAPASPLRRMVRPG